MMVSEEVINKVIEEGNKHRARVREEKTRTAFGWFDTYDDRFEMFNSILNTYLTYNLSGGSLHIYIDDGNKGVDNVKFCRNYAQENGDWIGVYLCDELLFFGEEFINQLIDDDIHLAWADWKSRNGC